MLINVKIPTIVGIKSMINMTAEGLNARRGFIFIILIFYKQLKVQGYTTFSCSTQLSMKFHLLIKQKKK